MLYLLAEISASYGAAVMVDEFSRKNERVALGAGWSVVSGQSQYHTIPYGSCW
jgi:hypothetical protein